MFGVTPEEFEAQMEQNRLNAEANRHDMHDWIESMDEHGLRMFRSLLFDYSEHSSASYLIGYAGHVLQQKYNICVACGKNHDEVITPEAIIGEGDTGNSEGPSVHYDTRGDTVEKPYDYDKAAEDVNDKLLAAQAHRQAERDGAKRGDTVTHGKAFEEMSGPELLATIPKKIQDQMDEYGVDFIEHQWPKVKCANCGDEYVSLEDRMKRDPGVKGCASCQQKAKWG